MGVGQVVVVGLIMHVLLPLCLNQRSDYVSQAMMVLVRLWTVQKLGQGEGQTTGTYES